MDKYKEALNKAKKLMETSVAFDRFTIEQIFPELKESEDERIRESIIENLKGNMCRTDGDYDLLNKQIAWLEKQGEKKPINKVEPKFKVKYAGSEYNVLEVKDIAGVTYYGIEDEPNHIDYIKAENCERVDGYNIKGNGSTYPTKSTVFSEQPHADKVEIEIPFGAKDSELQEATYYIPKGFHAEIDGDKVVIKKGEKPTAWSEEDEEILRTIISDGIRGAEFDMLQIDWLKSIKNKYAWKPSDEQMDALDGICSYIRNKADWEISQDMVSDLYKLSEQLKKLRGE